MGYKCLFLQNFPQGLNKRFGVVFHQPICYYSKGHKFLDINMSFTYYERTIIV